MNFKCISSLSFFAMPSLLWRITAHAIFSALSLDTCPLIVFPCSLWTIFSTDMTALSYITLICALIVFGSHVGDRGKMLYSAACSISLSWMAATIISHSLRQRSQGRRVSSLMCADSSHVSDIYMLTAVVRESGLWMSAYRQQDSALWLSLTLCIFGIALSFYFLRWVNIWTQKTVKRQIFYLCL